MGSSFEADKDGNTDTKTVINKELKVITMMELGSISEGILLKKYISSGNKVILKTSEKIVLIFSTL